MHGVPNSRRVFFFFAPHGPSRKCAMNCRSGFDTVVGCRVSGLGLRPHAVVGFNALTLFVLSGTIALSFAVPKPTLVAPYRVLSSCLYLVLMVL